MDSIYREEILERFQTPAFRGTLTQPSVKTRDTNPFCGDDITVELSMDEEGKIIAARFSGKGCAISQAAADLLMEELEGKTVDEVLEMTKEEMLELLGIPLGPVRVKCGLLAFKVAKMACLSYKGRKSHEV